MSSEPTMHRLLFVDDEPRILDGLKNLLRHRRRSWDMSFAPGGREALALLKTTAFDVVVSDMRMPKVDGAALLQHVKELHPGAVRIILSGFTELDAAMRAVPVAHQFLTKPCDAATLENSIERSLGLCHLNSQQGVRRVVGEITTLPAVPATYQALVQLLADPKTSAGEVSRLLETDVAMAAKVLHLVNSAYFGLARPVTRIEEAVVFLGVSMLKNLTLSVSVFGGKGENFPAEFDFDRLKRHAFLCAMLARKIVRDRRRVDEAFTAGLLHDIGKLLFAAHLPEAFAAAHRLTREGSLSMTEAELQVSGVSHAEVGGYLLTLWGLPHPVVEAVLHHHSPGLIAPTSTDSLAAVYIADQLAHEVEVAPGESGETCAPLAASYVETLGLHEEIEAWREEARRQAAAQPVPLS